MNTNVINIYDNAFPAKDKEPSYGSLMNAPLTDYHESTGTDRWKYYDYKSDSVKVTGKDLVLRSEGSPFMLVPIDVSEAMYHSSNKIQQYYSKAYRNYLQKTFSSATVNDYLNRLKSTVNKFFK